MSPPSSSGESGAPEAPAPADEQVLSVVAVVVTRDAGDWFDKTLASLAEQDHPDLAVLVIDAGSETDPTERVADALPDAFVRRLDDNPGYGAAANQALDMVEGASLLLFCHDDVRLDPGAVRVMVGEARRSNAGVVGPKLVDWADSRKLLSIGMGADKTGAAYPHVDRGEFDQEQHDRVRDVFYVPGGCTLVRADLFRSLGGFDEAITFHGEDLDLCWRAHVAGARVVVAPGAQVAHLEALGRRRPKDDRRRLQTRHRLRTVLSSYGMFHLVRVLPQVAVLSVLEIGYGIAVGRFGQARDVVAAWFWNMARTGQVLGNRRELRRVRHVSDGEVRDLQAAGFARLTSLTRVPSGEDGDDEVTPLARSAQRAVDFLRSGPSRETVFVWLGLLAVVVGGSRHLITRAIPAVGEFATMTGPATLLEQWTSAWRSVGLGAEAAAPTAFGVLGALGGVFLRQTGLLRTVLIVGMLPLGALGAWRLMAPTGSGRARLVGLVTYAIVPLPYNALAGGEWRALVAYAAAPWVLSGLARATNLPPFDTPRRSAFELALGVGVVLAFAAVIAPVMVVVALVMAAGLAGGAVLTGHPWSAVRVLVVGAGGAVVALVLHLPWSAEVVEADWYALGGMRDVGSIDFLALLRFDTGPVGAAPVGYLLPAAALLPLLIGKAWRLEWAVRGWILALAALAVPWAFHQGWLDFPAPAEELLLAPAAAALALTAAMGMAAFEQDVRGGTFGWRQLAALGTAAALTVAAFPALNASFDGRWDLPRGDYGVSLGFLGAEVEESPFRVLWVGDARVLPLAGWELDGGGSYATTDHGQPRVEDLFAGAEEGATPLLGDALGAAAEGQTNRIGRLMAPMGVRYLIVVEQRAPEPFEHERIEAPADLTESLTAQLDLEQLAVNPALTVYRNTAWAPTRTVLPEEAREVAIEADGAALPRMNQVEFDEPEPAVAGELDFADYGGEVPDDSLVYLANAPSQRWKLEVDGENVPSTPAFGWANAFDVDEGGPATLRYETPFERYVVLLVQVALWGVALLILLRRRLRRLVNPK